MINTPPVNELQDKVGCRYMLVTVVSKRARQLMMDPNKLEDGKPVSVAIEELYQDKLDIKFPEEYQK